ncbi:Iron(III) transport system permease protein OS=Castellaniella defragrans OX=75697 GN=HNR28_000886 PE=3 SV=1 [Castellaniella defragrans]
MGAYWEALAGNGPTGLALWDSIRLAAVGATLIMLVSVCVTTLGYWMKPGKLSSIFDGILKLPAGFSHVIVSIGVLLVFFAEPFNLSGTLLIIGIAYLIIYMPQGSIAATSAISQVDLQLLEASQMAGAGPARTGWRILLPLSLGGLANGWVLVFVYIIGDLTASVLLSGTATPTVGYVLLQEFNNGSYPVIAALAVVISLASSVVVLSILALTSRHKHA